MGSMMTSLVALAPCLFCWRAGLAEQGISLPQDMWFVAGLHDTTTDTVRLFDLDRVPRRHTGDIQAQRDWLAEASPLADRERTRQARLGGRVFPHNYDFRQDADGSILELIMTAPLVAASWINLQYYASTVDNRVFGSGNKTIHNVVGTVGVAQGNGGDLQVGLPWQSLRDGQKLIHEPLRLSVYIEAPAEAIERVIAKHETVRQLVDHHWLHLFRIEGCGSQYYRYLGLGHWLAETGHRPEV